MEKDDARVRTRANILIFSHPDYTVGSGFTPDLLCGVAARLAGSPGLARNTAGLELPGRYDRLTMPRRLWSKLGISVYNRYRFSDEGKVPSFIAEVPHGLCCSRADPEQEPHMTKEAASRFTDSAVSSRSSL